MRFFLKSGSQLKMILAIIRKLNSVKKRSIHLTTIGNANIGPISLFYKYSV